MGKFILGFLVCWYVDRHLNEINNWLQATVAKLELKRDMLKHDNPELS